MECRAGAAEPRQRCLMVDQELSIAEAAASLGVTARALRKSVIRGTLATQIKQTPRGPARRVDAAEVERYRRENLGKPGRKSKQPASTAHG